MKKTILALLLLATAAALHAQAQVKYGLISYDSLLRAMPEYEEMTRQTDTLRAQYQREADYNMQEFERMFADYLQGQKDFPKNILTKRQRDLQEAMEKNMAFKHECDSLIAEAQREMLAPIRRKLNAAIRDVGLDRGYECIIDRESGMFPFVHEAVSEDATPFVLQKINSIAHGNK